MRDFQLYIDGAFVPAAGGETFESLNPYTQETLATIARGQSADIEKAVKAARKAFNGGPWPRMTGAERGAILKQIADKLETAMPELIQWVVNESGSTYRKAKGEVWLSGKHLGYFAKLAEKQSYSQPIESLSRPGMSSNLLVKEPIGVCAQIIPWNFPLQMAIWKLGPALAAGNTVVLKPAEETSGVAMLLAEAIAASDLPPGVVNIVTGYGNEAGAALAAHPDVDKIAFTGSTEIGKKLMAEAATGLKRVTLELGGKSANIVMDDADLSIAVDGSLYAAFFHAGQACTAGTRLLLQDGIYDAFMEKFLARAKTIVVGDPASKGTDLGPLVSKKQQARVKGYIQKGIEEGATVVLGGLDSIDGHSDSACFVAPTVFTNVERTMTIAQEEIFGPVLTVFRFKDEAEAVAIANDSRYGLAGAVWSQNADTAMRVARQLRTGTVWINEYHLISEKAPFGGYKESGLGRELGEASLDEYLEIKHIHIDEVGERAKKFWYDAVVPLPAQPAVTPV